MATMSVISNDGALESASAVLEVTATNPEYNQPALRIRQAIHVGVRPRSGSMTRIPISNSWRPIKSLPPGSMRSPFSRTSYRSTAAMPTMKASKLLSYFSG